MKSLNLASVSATETMGLNGLPRRRAPEPLQSKRGIQAIRELRRLTPPIDLSPGTESAFVERGGLTPSRCLQWLEVAKQLYESPAMLSDPSPLRNLPPIAFLNLLIEWIEDYARITGRQRNQGPSWRWNALRGFVCKSRRLQTRRFKTHVLRFSGSIAAHFLKPPLESHFAALWEDSHRSTYLAGARCSSSATTVGDINERGLLADRVFAVLRRFRNDGKISAEDYQTLEPFLSKRFHLPVVIDAFQNKRGHESFREFIRYAAAMDVHLQYLNLMNEIAVFGDYVEAATRWTLRLGEPSSISKFEAICWRFGAPSAFKPYQRQKKAYPLLHTD
jgi:hypothetical protein